MLDDQPDCNRIWADASDPESKLARPVLAARRDTPLFAAVDLHDNTGHDPHFAIVTNLASETLSLSFRFSDHAVLVREPSTTLTRSIRDLCPAVTIELGPVGDPRADERAHDCLSRCLALERIPENDTANLAIYRMRARVHIAADVSFSFAGDPGSAQPTLTSGVEGVNFHPLPEGTEFGTTDLPVDRTFNVLDNDHRNVTQDYLEVVDGRILLKQAVTPSMYTTEPAVIRQDCLCYFMERFRLR
jgi:hypothetical protein